MEFNETLLMLVSSLIVPIMQAVKGIEIVRDNPRWQPFISMGLGVVMVVVVRTAFPPEVQIPISQAIGRFLLFGIMCGLSAAGLYDVGKEWLFSRKGKDILKDVSNTPVK